MNKSKLTFLTAFFGLLCITGIFSVAIYPQNQTAPGNSAPDPQTDLESFLKADASDARVIMAGFSDETISKLAEGVKKSLADNKKLSSTDLRKLWLLEESYNRKADMVASKRLFYVFTAVALLMSLIFILTLKIYQLQKKLENR